MRRLIECGTINIAETNNIERNIIKDLPIIDRIAFMDMAGNWCPNFPHNCTCPFDCVQAEERRQKILEEQSKKDDDSSKERLNEDDPYPDNDENLPGYSKYW